MDNIGLTGNPTQQVLVYAVTIRRFNKRWQIRYKYDGETGSLTMPSLKKAREWCIDRQLEYEMS